MCVVEGSAKTINGPHYIQFIQFTCYQSIYYLLYQFADRHSIPLVEA